MSVKFGLDMKAFCKKYEDRLDVVVRKTLLSLGTNLVLRSPVGDPSLWKTPAPAGYVGGRFRANWQYGFNVPVSGNLDKVDADGKGTIDNMNNRMQQQDASGIHFITNNLPYANRLEYGHSSQAPQGMVGITVVEFNDYITKAVADAKADKK